MAKVQWIRLTTDMFDNRKIKHLRKLPEGNNIVLIWVMLLTMAGRCNASGMIFLTENIPYTTKMLADELDFEENTVILALEVLEQFEMIVRNGDLLSIAGWEEHQNADGLERIREQNRQRQARFKERKNQALLCDNVTNNVTVTLPITLGNATEEDKEEEIEKDKKNKRVDYQQIVDLFHALCPSFPSVKTISDSRKKAIKARLNTYSMDDFRTLFEKAEKSDFLKGANDRSWTATFDWLIKDANMTKVLEGNYDNKAKKPVAKKNGFNNFEGRQYGKHEMQAMERMLLNRQNPPPTAGTDEGVKRRMEEVKERLGV